MSSGGGKKGTKAKAGGKGKRGAGQTEDGVEGTEAPMDVTRRPGSFDVALSELEEIGNVTGKKHSRTDEVKQTSSPVASSSETDAESLITDAASAASESFFIDDEKMQVDETAEEMHERKRVRIQEASMASKRLREETVKVIQPLKELPEIGSGRRAIEMMLNEKHKAFLLTSDASRLNVGDVCQVVIDRHQYLTGRLARLITHSDRLVVERNVAYMKLLASIRFTASPTLEFIAPVAVFLDDILERFVIWIDNLDVSFYNNSILDPRRTVVFCCFRGFMYRVAHAMNRQTILSRELMKENGFRLTRMIKVDDKPKTFEFFNTRLKKEETQLITDFVDDDVFLPWDKINVTVLYSNPLFTTESDENIAVKFVNNTRGLCGCVLSYVPFSYLAHLSAAFSFMSLTKDKTKGYSKDCVKLYRGMAYLFGSHQLDTMDSFHWDAEQPCDIDPMFLFYIGLPFATVANFHIYVLVTRLYSLSGQSSKVRNVINEDTMETIKDTIQRYLLEEKEFDPHRASKMFSHLASMSLFNIPSLSIPETSILNEYLLPKLDLDEVKTTKDAMKGFSTIPNKEAIDLCYGRICGPLRFFLQYAFLNSTSLGTGYARNVVFQTVGEGTNEAFKLSGLNDDMLNQRLLFQFLPVYLQYLHDFTVTFLTFIQTASNSVDGLTNDQFIGEVKTALKAILMSFIALVKDPDPDARILKTEFYSAVDFITGTYDQTTIPAFCTLTAFQAFLNVIQLRPVLDKPFQPSYDSLFMFADKDFQMNLLTELQDLSFSAFGIEMADTSAYRIDMEQYVEYVDSGIFTMAVDPENYFNEMFSFLGGEGKDRARSGSLIRLGTYETSLPVSTRPKTIFQEQIIPRYELHVLTEPFHVLENLELQMKPVFRYYSSILALSMTRGYFDTMKEKLRTMRSGTSTGSLKEIAVVNLIQSAGQIGVVKEWLAEYIKLWPSYIANDEDYRYDLTFILAGLDFGRRLKISELDEIFTTYSPTKLRDFVFKGIAAPQASKSVRNAIATNIKVISESLGLSKTPSFSDTEVLDLFDATRKIVTDFFNHGSSLRSLLPSPSTTKGPTTSTGTPTPFSSSSSSSSSSRDPFSAPTPSSTPPSTTDLIGGKIGNSLNTVIMNAEMGTKRAGDSPIDEKEVVIKAAASSREADGVTMTNAVAGTEAGAEGVKDAVEQGVRLTCAVQIAMESQKVAAAMVDVATESERRENSGEAVAEIAEMLDNGNDPCVNQGSGTLAVAISKLAETTREYEQSSMDDGSADEGTGSSSSSSAPEDSGNGLDMGSSLSSMGGAISGSFTLSVAENEAYRRLSQLLQNSVDVFYHLPSTNSFKKLRLGKGIDGNIDTLIAMIEDMTREQKVDFVDNTVTVDDFFKGSEGVEGFGFHMRFTREVYDILMKVAAVTKSSLISKDDLRNVCLPVLVSEVHSALEQIKAKRGVDDESTRQAEIENSLLVSAVNELVMQVLKFLGDNSIASMHTGGLQMSDIAGLKEVINRLFEKNKSVEANYQALLTSNTTMVDRTRYLTDKMKKRLAALRLPAGDPDSEPDAPDLEVVVGQVENLARQFSEMRMLRFAVVSKCKEAFHSMRLIQDVLEKRFNTKFGWDLTDGALVKITSGNSTEITKFISSLCGGMQFFASEQCLRIIKESSRSFSGIDIRSAVKDAAAGKTMRATGSTPLSLSSAGPNTMGTPLSGIGSTIFDKSLQNARAVFSNIVNNYKNQTTEPVDERAMDIIESMAIFSILRQDEDIKLLMKEARKNQPIKAALEYIAEEKSLSIATMSQISSDISGMLKSDDSPLKVLFEKSRKGLSMNKPPDGRIDNEGPGSSDTGPTLESVTTQSVQKN